MDGFKRIRCETKYSHFHVCVFVLTFLCYALIHANRKSFSNVKVLVSEEWSPSHFNDSVKLKFPEETWANHNFFSSSNDRSCKAFLGVLDTVFMIVYAISLYASGPLGDRFNLRYLLCGSMAGTSITVILFACVSEWLGFYSIYWYIIFWIINGLFQGPIWPCVLAIMGNWFGISHRGLIFGIWSANASVGNILGSLIVASYVDYGYDIAVLVPAVILMSFSIILFFGMVVSPVEIGQPLADAQTELSDQIPVKSDANLVSEPLDEKKETLLEEVGTVDNLVEETNVVVLLDSDKGEKVVVIAPSQSHQKMKAFGFIEALCLPGVIIYSLAYACLKLVNYAFFFWLPYYLNRQFHWSQADADNLSIWYDVGGIIGAIVGGLLSDHLKRAPVMFVMLLLAIPSLIFYNFLPVDKLLNAIVLSIVGFFIGGVANLLSSAVAADLGRHHTLSGSKSALATVGGIIDGTGSAGAAIGQILIPLIEQMFGWIAVFHMLVACTTLTCIGVGRMVYSELKRHKRLRRAFSRCIRVENPATNEVVVMNNANATMTASETTKEKCADLPPNQTATVAAS